ncbi:hypothetical protein [Streptomyces caniscabiei]|uniref:hypothetical protein n=2 Tax=Streptomyces caniscabiei TaxID=2746961 RepID=UPI00187308BC|nr:hypothetical protein [Streptomyces caniscabiei]MBE4783943.1 hypothetical protein [Streptomyces caniscabiei]MBE4791558.1 hypothetical protein [Streptomyces caniscabiei]MDX3009205.1 hypothetical protein [Streptomyces caniscabiei]
MSMPYNPFRRNPRRNQEPEPVRPGSRPLARGINGEAPALDPLPPLARDLQAAQDEAARWKRHADTYDTERAEASALSHHYRDELERAEKERDGAYRERAQLLAWLAALHPATTVITASPDVDEDGWQLLYLVAGGWQLSWHIHPRDAELFRHVTVVDVTDVRAQWDGHGSEQKYERIHNHVRLLALDSLGADGASTAVTPEVRSA